MYEYKTIWSKEGKSEAYLNVAPCCVCIFSCFKMLAFQGLLFISCVKIASCWSDLTALLRPRREKRRGGEDGPNLAQYTERELPLPVYFFFTAEGHTGLELLARAHSARASWILLAVFIKLTLIHVFDLLSTKACGSL